MPVGAYPYFDVSALEAKPPVFGIGFRMTTAGTSVEITKNAFTVVVDSDLGSSSHSPAHAVFLFAVAEEVVMFKNSALRTVSIVKSLSFSLRFPHLPGDIIKYPHRNLSRER